MKTQLKMQKLIILFVLIAFAAALVFSLGLSTDVYAMLYNFAGADGNSAKDRVEGAHFYYDLQPFNKLLTTISLIGLLVCLSVFLTNSTSRRKYYLANYLTAGITGVYGIVSSVWAVIQVLHYKNLYQTTVDFDQLAYWIDLIPTMTYTESTFWFDICAASFVVLFLASLALIGNAIWKFLLLKREDDLLNGKFAPTSNFAKEDKVS